MVGTPELLYNGMVIFQNLASADGAIEMWRRVIKAETNTDIKVLLVGDLRTKWKNPLLLSPLPYFTPGTYHTFHLSSYCIAF